MIHTRAAHVDSGAVESEVAVNWGVEDLAEVDSVAVGSKGDEGKTKNNKRKRSTAAAPKNPHTRNKAVKASKQSTSPISLISSPILSPILSPKVNVNHGLMAAKLVARRRSHATAPRYGTIHAAAPPPLARAMAPAVSAAATRPHHPTPTAAPNLPSTNNT